jgi:two-component system NtrC family response regulator
LRERNDDVVFLAKSFLQRCANEAGKSGASFTPEALRAIRQYEWPGNVRELQNRVRRAAIMAEEKRITPGDLEIAHVLASDAPISLRDAREKVEREMATQALRRSGGNISTAAAELGISRPAFYELLAKLGIDHK